MDIEISNTKKKKREFSTIDNNGMINKKWCARIFRYEATLLTVPFLSTNILE
jgi:hypothetical protein